MSLDTKYRPRVYSDVLGQDATKKILRQFVASGKGYEQSYLLAGPFGSGKTTLGRILAQALLCDDPVDGDPCGKCPTCETLLNGGTVDTFTEVDAATHSGKSEIKNITDQLRYDTFSGKRRLYLFDEAHRLSPSALDAMLKPLEESATGTEDRKLVCIFCTTEPEKMRNTILSRCAPAFIIRPLDPKAIAKRLEFVCVQEGIEYEQEALQLIAEITECHIRDALKAIEGVRMLGVVNKANVTEYLHLDLNDLYLDILDNIGVDEVAALQAAQSLSERTPATTCYQSLADVSMAAFHAYLGAGSLPSFWNKDRVKALSLKGQQLLNYALRFGSRPGRPTSSMLMCDISFLHATGGQTADGQGLVIVQAPAITQNSVRLPSVDPGSPPPVVVEKVEDTKVVPSAVTSSSGSGKVTEPTELRGGGVFVDQRGVRRKKVKPEQAPAKRRSSELEPGLFCRLVGLEMMEMAATHGPSG